MINLARRLRLGIAPAAPLLTGQVTAVDADGVTVALTGGGTIKARGAAAISDHVYVRAGVIEGPAPNLPGGHFEI